MKPKKLFSYIILSIIFIFAGFASGYLIGKVIFTPNTNNSSTTKTNAATPVPLPVMQLSPSPIPTAFSIYYMLKNENEILNLYEILGENKQLIKSVEINSAVLPFDDRQRLLSGIKLQTREEGFTMIEDFSS